MNEKIKILYIDDNPMDKALVRDALEREHGGFVLVEAANRKEYEKLLSQQDFDLVLSDFNILGFEGLQVIDFIKANYSQIPIIIVTGTGSEEIAVEAMKRGASDYIIKSPRHIKRLPHSIKNTLKTFRLQKSKEIIYHISHATLKNYNLSDFIQYIKEELGKIIDTTNFFVVLHDEISNNLQLPYFHDTMDNFKAFPAEKTLTHYVIKTRKPLLAKLDDIIQLEKKGHIKRIGTDAQVWMGIPLKIDSKVIGAMVVQSYTDPCAYTSDDLELMEIISAAISLAIYNKKNEVELKELNKLLRAKNKELYDKIQKIEKYAEELKKAKNKAEESERLKTAFLANMSHEIRTPMNAIMGFLELLKEPGLDEEHKNKYINIVTKSANRLLRTINSILEVSRIDAGTVQPHLSEFNLSRLIVEQGDFYLLKAKNKGLDFRLHVPEEDIFVKSDKTKLESILSNLISNAIKYTDKGYVEVSLNTDKDNLIVSVKDTGSGIPEQDQEKIFDRFYRVDDKYQGDKAGTGLGLSIVKSYVEMLGGFIKLESTVGKGSVFYVGFDKSIIVSEIAEKKDIQSKTIELKRDTDVTILIAEDDDSNYEYLAMVLKPFKYKLLRAKTGKEAVDICKKERVNLVLMDVKLPVMDGLEATKEILNIKPDLPIIAQTAYAFSEDKEKALSSGCVDYLSKPILRNMLLEKINKYLN